MSCKMEIFATLGLMYNTMKEFIVNNNITSPFELFGKTHIACIIVVM